MTAYRYTLRYYNRRKWIRVIIECAIFGAIVGGLVYAICVWGIR